MLMSAIIIFKSFLEAWINEIRCPQHILQRNKVASHSPFISVLKKKKGNKIILVISQRECVVGMNFILQNTMQKPSYFPPFSKSFLVYPKLLTGFPSGSVVNNLLANADLGSIPGLGRSSGEGNGNLLQYSCLGNPIDRGAWQATFHRVAKNQTQFSG